MGWSQNNSTRRASERCWRIASFDADRIVQSMSKVEVKKKRGGEEENTCKERKKRRRGRESWREKEIHRENVFKKKTCTYTCS